MSTVRPLPRAALPAAASAAALLTSAVLAGCGAQRTADQVQVPLPPGPHLALEVRADRATHYEMLCAIRAYKVGPGQYANRYGVNQTGPFHDVIPSPNARCTAKIVAGRPPVEIAVSRPGARQTLTLERPGDAGKKSLVLW